MVRVRVGVSLQWVRVRAGLMVRVGVSLQCGQGAQGAPHVALYILIRIRVRATVEVWGR